MKFKILTIIIICILRTIVVFGQPRDFKLDDPIQISNSDRYEIFKWMNLDDSLISQLSNNKLIVEMCCHYVCNWVIIAESDSTFRIISGSNDTITNMEKNHPFDTVKLINRNESIITWALNELPSQAKGMCVVKDSDFMQLGCRWLIFNPDEVNIMWRDQVKSYSGPDSIVFNQKVNSLSRLFMWLKYLPIRDCYEYPDEKIDKFQPKNHVQEPKADVSPYSYCASNPIVFIDPTGERIEGVSKDDADYLVEDFQSIFTGDEFKEFRKLIVRDGKKHNKRNLAPISPEARAAAFEGVTLNEDQTALVDMFVNAVNSEWKMKVEFAPADGFISISSSNVISSKISPVLKSFMQQPDGSFQSSIIKPLGGEGITTKYSGGSCSILFKENSKYEIGRAVITGHEVLEHGYSLSFEGRDAYQDKDAIQTENLIRRVMGIESQRNGDNHGGYFPEYSKLPDYR